MNVGKTCVSLLLLSGTLAWCQVPRHNEADTTNGDFYVGGTFNSNNPGNGTAGLGGGVDVRVFRMLAVAGEVDSYIGNSSVANTTMLFDYLVGPRVLFHSPGRLSPFADVLAGGQYLHNGSTQHSYYYGNGGGAAVAADGGIDVRLARHVSVRGEAGFIHSTFATAPTTTSNDRMRAGAFVVFRF